MVRRVERPGGGESGFTFVEVVITVAIIGLMAAWGYPALLKTFNRVKLTRIARETSVFMQKARMEAIKRSLDTQVIYLPAVSSPNGLPSILAFTDVDGDGAFISGIDDVLAGPEPLPKGIELRAPTQVREDTKAIVGWDEVAAANDGPVFASDGTVHTSGAFRFADPSNNYLEVRIEFLGTGKPGIQKWFGGGNPDVNWYENGENGKYWSW